MIVRPLERAVPYSPLQPVHMHLERSKPIGEFPALDLYSAWLFTKHVAAWNSVGQTAPRRVTVSAQSFPPGPRFFESCSVPAIGAPRRPGPGAKPGRSAL